jgi:uncharacterized protein
MVPLGDSMVYLRPLYVAATTKPQPQLQYVVAVLGKNVQIESSLAAVLGDITQAQVPQAQGNGSGGPPTTGTVPAAVSQDLQEAQTEYKNAQAALQAGNLGQYQSDIAAAEQDIAAAQQVLGSSSTATTTTTTTTQPKGAKSKGKSGGASTSTSSTTSSTTTSAPTSTEPQGSSTTTTLASAAAAP